MADADWIKILRDECERTSQTKVAARLGVSDSSVNQLLKGSYKASTKRLEARVRGELMKETVTCPVLGEISSKRCQDHQARPFATTNPTRVALYMACRKGCKHSKLKEGT